MTRRWRCVVQVGEKVWIPNAYDEAATEGRYRARWLPSKVHCPDVVLAGASASCRGPVVHRGATVASMSLCSRGPSRVRIPAQRLCVRSPRIAVTCGSLGEKHS